MMPKDLLEEARQYLRANNALMFSGLRNGEPIYKLNITFATTILENYDKCAITRLRPKNWLSGALILAVMNLNKEGGFSSKQLAAACTVLEPLAGELIKRRSRGN
jgi:hypothetical protein